MEVTRWSFLLFVEYVKAVTCIEYPIFQMFTDTLSNATYTKIDKHFGIRKHGRLSYVIYYATKPRIYAFYLRYDGEKDKYVLELFYDHNRKIKVYKYFRRMLCYPSFIDFLKKVNIDPRKIIINEKVIA